MLPLPKHLFKTFHGSNHGLLFAQCLYHGSRLRPKAISVSPPVPPVPPLTLWRSSSDGLKQWILLVEMITWVAIMMTCTMKTFLITFLRDGPSVPSLNNFHRQLTDELTAFFSRSPQAVHREGGVVAGVVGGQVSRTSVVLELARLGRRRRRFIVVSATPSQIIRACGPAWVLLRMAILVWDIYRFLFPRNKPFLPFPNDVHRQLVDEPSGLPCVHTVHTVPLRR